MNWRVFRLNVEIWELPVVEQLLRNTSPNLNKMQNMTRNYKKMKLKKKDNIKEKMIIPDFNFEKM